MRAGKIIVAKESKTFPDYGPGKCLYCGGDLPPLRRKYCCDHHGAKYRLDVSFHKYIYWGEFRNLILERDNYKCLDCGDEAEDVHHRKPIYSGGLEFDEGNCISLCIKCHKLRHRKRDPLIENGKHKQLTIDLHTPTHTI